MPHLKQKPNGEKLATHSPPENHNTAESFLTRQELADRWAVCSHTIARRKDLRPIRLGARLVRYRIGDVLEIERGAAA